MIIELKTPAKAELDASELSCPLPIVKARKAMSALASGEVLRVLSTDPGSISDFASFCKTTGHELVASGETSGRYEFLIRKQ